MRKPCKYIATWYCIEEEEDVSLEKNVTENELSLEIRTEIKTTRQIDIRLLPKCLECICLSLSW